MRVRRRATLSVSDVKEMGQPPPSKAIAVFDQNGVGGVVRLERLPRGVGVDVKLHGLPPGAHGLHVHEFGDVGGGCERCGPHYSPSGHRHHGGRQGSARHPGDLGNVVADAAGQVRAAFVVPQTCLRDLLGRSLVLHAGEDDLGRGRGAARRESLLTGNSGARLACAVIGLAAP